jgi:hypothetical protein
MERSTTVRLYPLLGRVAGRATSRSLRVSRPAAGVWLSSGVVAPSHSVCSSAARSRDREAAGRLPACRYAWAAALNASAAR